VAFDGSWGHRRNADQCFGAFIAYPPDLEHAAHGKVVEFDFAIRGVRGLTGNYIGSSQGMETAVLELMANRWKGDPRVTGFVHDQDAKAIKTIRDLGWDVTEYRDHNHVFKSIFETAWKNCNFVDVEEPVKPGKKAPKKKRRRWALSGLKTALMKHLRFCLNKEFDTEEDRRNTWFGAEEHYIHPKSEEGAWKLRDDEVSRRQLHEFLVQIWAKVPELQTAFSTQACESLNALKAKCAKKEQNFTTSWEARCALAVLIMNHGHQAIVDLMTRLDCWDDLSPESQKVILDDVADAESQRRKRRSPDFRAKRKQSRQRTRERRDGEVATGKARREHVVKDEVIPSRPSTTEATGSCSTSQVIAHVTKVVESIVPPLAADVVRQNTIRGTAVPLAGFEWAISEIEGFEFRIVNNPPNRCHMISVLEVFLTIPQVFDLFIYVEEDVLGCDELLRELAALRASRRHVVTLDRFVSVLRRDHPEVFGMVGDPAEEYFGKRRDCLASWDGLIGCVSVHGGDFGRELCGMFGMTWTYVFEAQIDWKREGCFTRQTDHVRETNHFSLAVYDMPVKPRDRWLDLVQSCACGTCNKRHAFAKRLLMIKVPRVLCVQISFNVLGSSCAVPLTFLALVLDRNEEVEFGLTAFIKLEGAGHYVAYCRVGLDSWMLYDDASKPVIVNDISVDGWIIWPVQMALYLPRP
jgi:hypothetical protein